MTEGKEGLVKVRCNENRRRVAMVTHKGVGDSITPNGRLAAKKMAGQPTLKQVCVHTSLKSGWSANPESV